MIVPIDRVKKFLNISQSNDTFIKTLITSVQALIENYCNQNIVEATNTIVFDGNTESEYTIYKHPINSITSVKYKILDSSEDFTSGTALSENTDFYVRTRNGIKSLYFVNGLWLGYIYELKFSSGYYATGTSENMPEDIRHIALEWISYLIKQSNIDGIGQNQFGLSSKSESNREFTGTTTFKDMKPEWQAILNKYRIPVV